MKRSFAAFLSLAAILVASSANAAEEGRFDAQVFRPLAAPRDLVMVPKSEVIGHLSPVLGLYWDAALDPRQPDPTVPPDNNQIPHCAGLHG